MKKKNYCPYKALIVVVNEGKTYEDKILAVLKNYDISRSVVSVAKGTAPSNISDFFGFGIENKTLVSTFVESDRAKEIMFELKETLELDKKNKGLVLTLPITALSSNILGLWRRNDETDNSEKECAESKNGKAEKSNKN